MTEKAMSTKRVAEYILILTSVDFFAIFNNRRYRNQFGLLYRHSRNQRSFSRRRFIQSNSVSWVLVIDWIVITGCSGWASVSVFFSVVVLRLAIVFSLYCA